jgi:hypothetical protein
LLVIEAISAKDIQVVLANGGRSSIQYKQPLTLETTVAITTRSRLLMPVGWRIREFQRILPDRRFRSQWN